MSDDEDTVSAAIDSYRNQVVAEAELARGDLDEIEDHLRTLTGELRDGGMPAAVAVSEAARRLGDPREVAREHARVRSPFGAKISRARAWSAALLIAFGLVWTAIEYIPREGVLSLSGLHFAFGLVLEGALIARLAWARPALLGGTAFFMLSTLSWMVVASEPTLWLLYHAGILAFLVPWRRGELTWAGASLALQAWSYGAAVYTLGHSAVTIDGSRFLVAPAALVALAATIIATCGGVLRARWGAVAAAISLTLVVAIPQLWAVLSAISEADGFGGSSPELFTGVMLALVGSGVVAAAASAVLSWRTARSNRGTLESVLR